MGMCRRGDVVKMRGHIWLRGMVCSVNVGACAGEWYHTM